MFNARMIRALGACAVLAFALPASAADPAHRIFALVAQNGSGEAGTVTLTPMGDKTRVEIALVGAPNDTPQASHVHAGPCPKLNPTPKYPLSSVVDGYASTTLDVPISHLTSGEFAINVHKSTSDFTEISCGDLGKK